MIRHGKKIITRRGCKHPDRIIDHSKSSTSVMFSGSASGVLLPPYVCYRAEHLYDTWTEGGPQGARYNRTKNGWFNLTVFEDWFFSVAVPYFKGFDKDVPKVLIGDNLSSHISLKVIQQCKTLNIRFVLLPPNSTHLCQPLDAAFFRPLKGKWRSVLDEWKSKHRGPIQKDCFPRLLKKCLLELDQNDESKKNLKSGFATTGIAPLDRTRVLKKLPGYEDPSENGTSNNSLQSNREQPQLDTSWAESLKEFLEEFRKTETTGTGTSNVHSSESVNKGLKKTQPKKKRLKVLPGKSVCEDDINEGPVPVSKKSQPQPGPSGLQKTKKQFAKEKDCEEDEEYAADLPATKSFLKKKSSDKNRKTEKRLAHDSSSSEDGHFSVHDMSSDLNFSPTSESDLEKETIPPKQKLLGNVFNAKPEDFVIVSLTYNEGSKKERVKRFIAKIISQEKDYFNVAFMRRSTKGTNIYIFPDEEDVGSVKKEALLGVVAPLFVRRGRYCFPVEMDP